MTVTTRITRDDLEAKMREISGEVDDSVEAAKPQLLSAALAGVFLLVVIAYILGRRGGRSRTARVEIRRL
jgi:hypothetical protein